MPFIEDFVDKIVASGMATRDKVIGCTESEIVELESAVQLQLPRTYKEFLRRMGRGAGGFWGGTDWTIDTLLQLQKDARTLLAKSDSQSFLSRHTFVFLMHQGYQFVSFECCDDEDPPIFRYLDGVSPTIGDGASSLERVCDCLSKCLGLCLEDEISAYKSLKGD